MPSDTKHSISERNIGNKSELFAWESRSSSYAGRKLQQVETKTQSTGKEGRPPANEPMSYTSSAEQSGQSLDDARPGTVRDAAAEQPVGGELAGGHTRIFRGSAPPPVTRISTWGRGPGICVWKLSVQFDAHGVPRTNDQ